jgi:hypothetical protein
MGIVQVFDLAFVPLLHNLDQRLLALLKLVFV